MSQMCCICKNEVYEHDKELNNIFNILMNIDTQDFYYEITENDIYKNYNDVIYMMNDPTKFRDATYKQLLDKMLYILCDVDKYGYGCKIFVYGLYNTYDANAIINCVWSAMTDIVCTKNKYILSLLIYFCSFIIESQTKFKQKALKIINLEDIKKLNNVIENNPKRIK